VSVLTEVVYEVSVVSSALLSSLDVHEWRLQWLAGVMLYLRAVHASDRGCWALGAGGVGRLVDDGRGLFGVGLN